MAKYTTEKGRFTGLGPFGEGSDVTVSAVSESRNAPVIELYSRKDRKKTGSVHFGRDCRMGSVYSMKIKDIDTENTLYRLRLGKNEYIDPYAKYISGNARFGKRDGFGAFIIP